MITVDEMREWARAELATRPSEIMGSADHEVLGRCLRALGEQPRADEHLRAALDAMRAPGAHKIRGGLWRLLGERDRADEEFRDELEALDRRGWHETLHAQAVWSCFMLGDHDAVLHHADRAGQPVAREATPVIAMLSRARLELTPELADEALEWLERELRRDRSAPFHSGGVNLFDIYEVGVDLQASLEGAG